jgi:CubicO group peptidase (beta-lactamase class C family)
MLALQRLELIMPRPPLFLSALLVTLSVQAVSAAEPPLSDYVGTYRVAAATTPLSSAAPAAASPVELVANAALFAVIDQAKYALKRVAGDSFVARSGDQVLFTRDASGIVNGAMVQGQRHERSSATVSQESSDLLWPRPDSRDAPVSYRYAAPKAMADGIRTADAADLGLNRQALEQAVQGVWDGTWPDVHSVLVYYGGRLVLEEYFYGYHAQRPHQMRSATKSVVSALAGMASTRSHAAQLATPVMARLPYASHANPDKRKQLITLEDLLTMRSGLACNDYDRNSPGNESTLYEAADWVQATLDLPMARNPGEQGLYCSAGVAVVGRLTELAVGKDLPSFAQEALFGPLGISRSDWRWNYELTRRNREYSQIHLRPRDLLKFGLLYAQGGRWDGQQIIPADWVKASLSKQSKIGGTDYGYFWWQPWLNVETAGGARRVDFSAAQGNGGQKIYIVPQHELVVVFTGGDYNSGGSPPNKIMATLILPAVMAAEERARKTTR